MVFLRSPFPADLIKTRSHHSRGCEGNQLTTDCTCTCSRTHRRANRRRLDKRWSIDCDRSRGRPPFKTAQQGIFQFLFVRRVSDQTQKSPSQLWNVSVLACCSRSCEASQSDVSVHISTLMHVLHASVPLCLPGAFQRPQMMQLAGTRRWLRARPWWHAYRETLHAGYRTAAWPRR